MLKTKSEISLCSFDSSEFTIIQLRVQWVNCLTIIYQSAKDFRQRLSLSVLCRESGMQKHQPRCIFSHTTQLWMFLKIHRRREKKKEWIVGSKYTGSEDFSLFFLVFSFFFLQIKTRNVWNATKQKPKAGLWELTSQAAEGEVISHLKTKAIYGCRNIW